MGLTSWVTADSPALYGSINPGTNDYFHYRLICCHFLDYSISCLVHKMSENDEKCLSLFPKAQGDIIHCPQPKDTQFTVTED